MRLALTQLLLETSVFSLAVRQRRNPQLDTPTTSVQQQSPSRASDGAIVGQPKIGDLRMAPGDNSQSGRRVPQVLAVDATGDGGVPSYVVDTGDPQLNAYLDPSQILTGLTLDGQQTLEPNQSPSATSNNSFINACLLTPDLPLTNGSQSFNSTCNAVPQGVLAALDKAPSSKFVQPMNLQVIQPNTTFNVTLRVNNLNTGWFTNAQQNFLSAPQATDDQGLILGHSHIVIEQVESLQSTALTSPVEFTFFKGLNTPAVDGQLSVAVDGGVGSGFYRLSSITTSANHAPVLIGVAQHGSVDDQIYFIASTDPNALAIALGFDVCATGSSDA